MPNYSGHPSQRQSSQALQYCSLSHRDMGDKLALATTFMYDRCLPHRKYQQLIVFQSHTLLTDTIHFQIWRTCSCACRGRRFEGSRLPGCVLMTAKPGASSTYRVSRPSQNPPTAVLRVRSSPPGLDRLPSPPGALATAPVAAAASSSSTKSADGCTSEANLGV